MRTYKHKNHTVYTLNKKVTFIKNHTKTLFWHKGKIVKNHRFKIGRNKKWKYFRWCIIQPFFYFERTNVEIHIGTPNRYFSFEYKNN